MGFASFLGGLCGGFKHTSKEGIDTQPGIENCEQDVGVTGPSTILLNGLASFRGCDGGTKQLKPPQAHAQRQGQGLKPAAATDGGLHAGFGCSSGKWVSGSTVPATDRTGTHSGSGAVAPVSGDAAPPLVPSPPSTRSLSHSAAGAAAPTSVHSTRSFSTPFKQHRSSRVMPADAEPQGLLASAGPPEMAATGSGRADGGGIGSGGGYLRRTGSDSRRVSAPAAAAPPHRAAQEVAQEQQQLAAAAGTMFRATSSFRWHGGDPHGPGLFPPRGRSCGPASHLPCPPQQRVSPLPNQYAHHQLFRTGSRHAHSFTVESLTRVNSSCRPLRGGVRPTADVCVSRSSSVTSGAGRKATAAAAGSSGGDGSRGGRSVSVSAASGTNGGGSGVNGGSAAGRGRRCASVSSAAGRFVSGASGADRQQGVSRSASARTGAEKGTSAAVKRHGRLAPLDPRSVAAAAAAAAVYDDGADDEGDVEPSDPWVAAPPATQAAPRASTFPSRYVASFTRNNQPVEALRALRAGVPDVA